MSSDCGVEASTEIPRSFTHLTVRHGRDGQRQARRYPRTVVTWRGPKAFRFDSQSIPGGNPARTIFRDDECGNCFNEHYPRRLHNFAIDMEWLLAPVIPRRKWPPIHFKGKRAITAEEHQKIPSITVTWATISSRAVSVDFSAPHNLSSGVTMLCKKPRQMVIP